jgi:hypothetical protein
VSALTEMSSEVAFGAMPMMAFLDEAGDHSLDPVDQDFPVFVLVFVLCDQNEYANVLVPAFTAFKIRYFGHDGVVLHSRDIRKAIGDCSFLQVPQKREAFYADLNGVMTAAKFELIAIAIRKQSREVRRSAGLASRLQDFPVAKTKGPDRSGPLADREFPVPIRLNGA